MADVSGIKWIRQEKNQFKKAVKALTLLIVGIVLVMASFVFWYA